MIAPQSFGKVTVTTGGTPARVTATRQQVRWVRFTALPANTGLFYVRTDGVGGDDRTNLTKTVGIGGAPTSATTGMSVVEFGSPIGPPQIDLSIFWIDVGVNGNGVLVAALP